MKIPIEVSGRHLHVTHQDLETLFGPGTTLRTAKTISQPHQFAAEETVQAIGPKGLFPNVRIIGPERSATQLEVTVTDCYTLGVTPFVSVSGELDGTPGGVELVGPAGTVQLQRGVIVAKRHLHISPAHAASLGIKHHDLVTIRTAGPRGLVFNNVVVRSRAGVDELAFMLDTDEANAAGVKQGDWAELVEG